MQTFVRVLAWLALFAGIGLMILALVFHLTMDPLLGIPFIAATGVVGLMLFLYAIEWVWRTRQNPPTQRGGNP